MIHTRQPLALLMVGLLTAITACTNVPSQSLDEGLATELDQEASELASESSPSGDMAAVDAPAKSSDADRYTEDPMFSRLSDRCQNAIATVADDIANTSDAYIGYATLPEGYRDDGLLLQLEANDTVVRQNGVQASSALVVLDDKPILAQYASTIIQVCQDITSVTFQISPSQATEFGMVNGQMTELDCVTTDIEPGGYGEDPYSARWCHTPSASRLEPLPPDFSASCGAAFVQLEAQLEQDYKTYIGYRATWGNEGVSGEGSGGDRPTTVYLSLSAYNSFGIGDVITYSAAVELMESPDALAQYAGGLMADCHTVGTVEFSLTEYQRRSFQMVDGRVKETTCDSPVSNTYCAP